jgi:hypothetical protein
MKGMKQTHQWYQWWLHLHRGRSRGSHISHATNVKKGIGKNLDQGFQIIFQSIEILKIQLCTVAWPTTANTTQYLLKTTTYLVKHNSNFTEHNNRSANHNNRFNQTHHNIFH